MKRPEIGATSPLNVASTKVGLSRGIDGQDFAEIEGYGVERWLAELALALRQETYRLEPIRQVYIPKANGKLRPLGISACGIGSA
jgi:hypothetical protein